MALNQADKVIVQETDHFWPTSRKSSVYLQTKTLSRSHTITLWLPVIPVAL